MAKEPVRKLSSLAYTTYYTILRGDWGGRKVPLGLFLGEISCQEAQVGDF